MSAYVSWDYEEALRDTERAPRITEGEFEGLVDERTKAVLAASKYREARIGARHGIVYQGLRCRKRDVSSAHPETEFIVSGIGTVDETITGEYHNELRDAIGVMVLWKKIHPDLLLRLIDLNGYEDPLGPLLDRAGGPMVFYSAAETFGMYNSLYKNEEDIFRILEAHRLKGRSGKAKAARKSPSDWVLEICRNGNLYDAAMCANGSGILEGETLSYRLAESNPVVYTIEDFEAFTPSADSIVREAVVRPPGTLRLIFKEPQRVTLVQWRQVVYDVDPGVIAPFTFQALDVDMRDPTAGFPNSTMWADEACTVHARHPNVNGGSVCLGNMRDAIDAKTAQLTGRSTVTLSEFLTGMGMANLDSAYFSALEAIFPNSTVEQQRRARESSDLENIPGVRRIASKVSDFFS